MQTRRTNSSKPRGPAFRLSGRGAVVIAAIIGLLLLFPTDQIVPATSERQAELRIWLVARASGVVTLILLAVQIALGLVLSHPTNKSTWKLSKLIFPWHEHLWVFVAAFLSAHVLSLVADPYAGVGIPGALIPGLSEYRSSAVALGSLALHAFIVTALTARYTKLLPPGAWLSLHRLAGSVFVLSWLHAVLAGTDSAALVALYASTGILVVFAAAYRYWVSRRQRPTFSTSRTEASAP